MGQGQNGTGARVSLSEAARRARVSRKTLRRWELAGTLSVDRSGPQPRVDIAELLRLGVLDRVGADMGHAGQMSQDVPGQVGATAEASELAALRAERDRLQDEVRWLRGRIEHLEGTIGQLALPAARAETPAPSSPDSRGRWARWWGWFVGRKEGS